VIALLVAVADEVLGDLGSGPADHCRAVTTACTYNVVTHTC
jgi:hypothetical protein